MTAYVRERERGSEITKILGNHITQPEQVSCGIKKPIFQVWHSYIHPIFQVRFNILWLENKSKGDNRNINLPEWAPNQLA